ncbi:hypothetical protein RAT170B_0836 [Rickettsia argasii T170-B]|uniref:Uncharacterized protein n=1 Tax=Rickettsia argasii T170-B TaxID=1268837 RepID=A0A0F3RFV6_9RICK|nr:hypothetical protein RAT170B_0836 [Rickettsia argasii T170-B]
MNYPKYRTITFTEESRTANINISQIKQQLELISVLRLKA